jgi:tripartite-type tricarboxylate transporter receptor subunit TctC
MFALQFTPKAVRMKNPIFPTVKITLACFITACSLLVATSVVAQNYPAKPIRMIVPFGAGTQSDVLGRLIGQKLTESWGQPVIIENRPGAGAILGTELAAKAVPDGYTLMVGGTGALCINPGLYAKLPYDPVRDFAPITKLVIVTQTLVANPSLAAKSVKALVALAKARPGQLNYGSFGAGSTNHLTTEMFQRAAGITLGNNVSFRGSADSNIQVMSGELPMMFDSMTSVLPHVKSGKLRGLAVSTATRSPFLPDLPTVAESGMPGFEVAGWTGVFAPAKTPEPVLDKINTELLAALAKPEVKEHFNQLAFTPAGESREAFRRHMLTEIVKWTKAIKDSGTKID